MICGRLCRNGYLQLQEKTTCLADSCFGIGNFYRGNQIVNGCGCVGNLSCVWSKIHGDYITFPTVRQTAILSFWKNAEI